MCRLFHALTQFLFTTSEKCECTTCECANADVGKLESFKRIPETLGTEIKHPADHPESNFWQLS